MALPQLKTRTISAIIFAAIMLASLLHWIAFLALMLFIAIIAIIEIKQMFEKKGVNIPLWFPIIVTVLSIIAVVMVLYNGQIGLTIWSSTAIASYSAIVVIVSPIVLFITTVFRKKSQPIISLGTTLMATIYIAIPFLIMQFLYNYHWSLVFAIFVLIWMNDAGAYMIGSAFGKKRICERISPLKSWEGFWGGLASSLLISVLFFIIGRYCQIGWMPQFAFSYFNLWQWMVVGVIISSMATIGDLFESLMKRSCDVKDSGKLIPGHGGILDRFDSMLAVVPVIAVFLLIVTFFNN
jgi:phosphatidate cytidylyltransferase